MDLPQIAHRQMEVKWKEKLLPFYPAKISLCKVKQGTWLKALCFAKACV